MPKSDLDKITSIIYYLYHHNKMHPNSVAGSYRIDEVFANACELLLNIDVEAFTRIEKGIMDNER